MKRSSVEAVIGLLVLATALRAQDTATVRFTHVDTLGPLVVTATRTLERPGTLGNSVTVLDGSALRRAGIATVSEALRGVTSIAQAQAGSWGAQTSLFVRGGESDYVRVLVDGVPLNQAGGAIDLAYLTTDNVERIEIVRGPASVLYGSDAMTGVIQIITRKAGSGAWAVGRGLQAMLSAEAGSRASSMERAEVSAGGARAGLSAGFERESTKGIYDFNNHHDNTAESVRLSLTPDAVSDVQVSVRHRDGVFHFPTNGSGAPVDSNAFGSSRQTTAGLDAGRRFGRRVELRALLAYADTRDSSDDQPDSPQDTTAGSSESGRGVRRESADLRAILRPAESVRVTVGGTIENQRERDQSSFVSPGFASSDKTDTTRTDRAVYVEANGGAGRLSVQTGARFDHNQRFGDFTTWRVGASLRVAPSTRLRIAAGTAFKEPTFDENFSTAFSTGNPSLKPERSQSAELGVEQQLGGRASASLTGFAQRFRDVIEFAYGGGAPAPDFQNISSARADGVEAEVRAEPVRGLGLVASYMYLHTVAGDSGADAFVFAKGQPLIRRPAQSGSLNAEWRGVSGHALGARVMYVGGRDDVTFVGFTEMRVRLDAYARLDLWGRIPVGGARGGNVFAITGRIENLTNTSYQETYGFRAPGRRVTVGGEISRR